MVSATGNPKPVVQWYRDSVLLTGKTGDSLQIDSITAAVNGLKFRALLTNCVDTIWSSAAILTVLANVSRWDAVQLDKSVWW